MILSTLQYVGPWMDDSWHAGLAVRVDASPAQRTRGRIRGAFSRPYGSLNAASSSINIAAMQQCKDVPSRRCNPEYHCWVPRARSEPREPTRIRPVSWRWPFVATASATC